MDLTQLQNHVLKILLEAGEENLPTVLNTVAVQVGGRQGDRFLNQIILAIQDLEEEGMVSFARYFNDREPSWVRLSREEMQQNFGPEQCLKWNDLAGIWEWKEADCGVERVYLLLEQAGRDAISDHLSW